MVLNTVTVGSAVTPTVISTFLSHYLNRKPRAQKPTAHISYDEGLHLIRRFLLHASHHTVEDVQRFTSQWVPSPRWVRVDHAKIGQEYITAAAEALREQLGHFGIERVGGKEWWQWRRPGSELKAEWIEMRTDYAERKRTNDKGKRVMLYVHGGAYFFGSVDEHRYQMQRHARKLKARVFAPRYRLAPQFPFPCGLHDCLAAYLYLVSVQDSSTIILAGDSAGGGMVVSLLVTIRDRGLPPPAGAILISPWVDLTHSFPSVSEDCPLDYIPPHGFHQRPSSSWPPPNADEVIQIIEAKVKRITQDNNIPQGSEIDVIQDKHAEENHNLGTPVNGAAAEKTTSILAGPSANPIPGSGHDLSIMIDGELIEIKDQIQMYANNQLLSHPLVSPVLQPSLGGLPPLLILTGGGETLRDEQIYLAHKAANPELYPPGDAFLNEDAHDHRRELIGKWKPTDVQLQVWDDMCHVGVTLSFTRPAKYMYRSIAQFGAWALARSQGTGIDIMDDDEVSIISSSESDNEDSNPENNKKSGPRHVGKAGDPLPAFRNHMIRQRVDRHGNIYHLEPASSLTACNIPSGQIGVIKEGPVRRWLKAKKEWDTKFASTKRRVQKQRSKEMVEGYQEFRNGEVPPPSALAGRRRKGDQDREEKKSRSWGMSLWALWGSKHDEMTLVREKQADKETDATTPFSTDAPTSTVPSDNNNANSAPIVAKMPATSRSRSRRRTVVDHGQTEGIFDENTPVADFLAITGDSIDGRRDTHLGPAFVAKHGSSATTSQPLRSSYSRPEHPEVLVTPENRSSTPTVLITSPDDRIDTSKHRPKSNGVAFPFTLKRRPDSSSSVETLTSAANISPAGELATTEELGAKGLRERAGADEVEAVGEGGWKETFMEAGQVVDGERPLLQSFVAAQEPFSKVE